MSNKRSVLQRMLDYLDRMDRAARGRGEKLDDEDAENLSELRRLQLAGYSRAQAQKGRRGAEARWRGNEAREAVERMVETLAARRDGLGDPEWPSELWPHLLSMMDDAGMSPREMRDPARYECDGLEQPYTYEAFRKQIRRIRNR